MHVPDGFLDAPTTVTTALVAAGAVGVSLRRSRAELDDRTAPLAGLVATFVFAAQMINFPVAAGTSGHLIGATLAAVLVGPWTATLCLTVILLVQALLFADGGLTALGTNVTLMGVVAVWTGYGTFRLARKLLPQRLASVPLAAGVAAFLSVPTAAVALAALYLVGGQAAVPATLLLSAMASVHALIGVGEAVITGLLIASVTAVRPDLVYGARGLARAAQQERADASLGATH